MCCWTGVQDNLKTCAYRIAQEGLPLLLPHLRKQRFQPSLDEFMRILAERVIKVCTIPGTPS